MLDAFTERSLPGSRVCIPDLRKPEKPVLLNAAGKTKSKEVAMGLHSVQECHRTMNSS